MQWDFTPEEVIKGEIHYPLWDFRQDLWEEVSDYTDPEGFEILFWALYHLAMGSSAEDMAIRWREQNELSEEETREQKQQFELIKSTHRADIEMLKAVIKRKILDYKEEGIGVLGEKELSDYILEWISQVVEEHEVQEQSGKTNGEMNGKSE